MICVSAARMQAAVLSFKFVVDDHRRFAQQPKEFAFLMPKRHKATSPKNKRESRESAFVLGAVSRYKYGDYLRVELPLRTDDVPTSVWISVDHCSEEHAIVFGTIESEPPQWLGKRLRLGARLAVSYRCVQECRQPL
jgi:hypothetical protein